MSRVSLDSVPRIGELVSLFRSISRATDPVEVQKEFDADLRRHVTADAYVSVSRRGLPRGQYKITRAVPREDMGVVAHDPWSRWSEIPAVSGGFIGRLIENDDPEIHHNLQIDHDPVMGDWLVPFHSCIAMPLFDEGEALNWAILFSHSPTGLDLPDMVDFLLRANMVGRITKTLVVNRKVVELNHRLSEQLEQVARLQQSLLPDRLPSVPGLGVATSYLTSNEAGGDYYDFFNLGSGRLGVVVADVSGHGAGAAGIVAMLHAILHAVPDRDAGPAAILDYANRQLAEKRLRSQFVTAFFGHLDLARRRFTYSNAGHNKPVHRRRSGAAEAIEDAASLPLGILNDTTYEQSAIDLEPGDTLVLYTDGITEAFSPPPDPEMFGMQRLRRALEECTGKPECVVDSVHQSLYQHTRSRDRVDDQTIVALQLDPDAKPGAGARR